MTQQTLPTKSIRTQVKELWRCQASPNIDDHDTLCAAEDCVLSSTTAGIKNSSPLVNFDEYKAL